MTKNVRTTRRDTLILLGAAGFPVGSCGGTDAGGFGKPSENASTNWGGSGGVSVGDVGSGRAGANDSPLCEVRPAQTIGPFPNKADLNRSDVRAGQKGTLLRLKLTVYSAGNCRPVPNALVDIWQCNAAGKYSEYSDFGTADQSWLRGFQVAAADGSVRFVTNYPGWYPGRSVHIHFRVRAASQTFVSQLYFEDALTARVHEQAPYNAQAGQRTLNLSDAIFRSGGDKLTLKVAQQGNEHLASFDLGIQLG